MSLERLWAPWRMGYIRGERAKECIFCAALAAGDDAAKLIVHRGERCFVMLNAYPYASGHLMVSPNEHVATLEGLRPEVLLELMELSQDALAALRDAFGPEGFNIGANQGRVSGGSVEDHFHQHVVPRWTGDTNFISVTGGVRVLPQSLEETYSALAASWPSRTA